MNIPKFRSSTRLFMPWLGVIALAAIVGLSSQHFSVGHTSAQQVEGTADVEKFVTTDDGVCVDVSTDDCVIAPGATGYFRIHVRVGVPFNVWFENSFYDDMPDGFLTGLVQVPDSDTGFADADFWACNDVPGTNDVQCNVFEFPDDADDQDNGECTTTGDEEDCAAYDVIIFFTAPDGCGDVEYTNSASVTSREYADDDLIGFDTDTLTVTVSGDPCVTATPTETGTATGTATGTPTGTPVPCGGTCGTPACGCGGGNVNNNNNNNINDNNNNNINDNNNSNNNSNNINIVIS